MALFTRLPIDRVTAGVFEFSDAQPVRHHTDVDQDELAVWIKTIEGGHRPTLDVYWRPANPELNFICADQIYMREAYRSLGISFVPVRILGKCPTEQLIESAIGLQIAGAGSKGRMELFPCQFKKLPTLLGSNDTLKRLTTKVALQRIIDLGTEVMSRLETFHQPSSMEIHYHETLHSVAFRIVQAASAFKLLAENTMERQAFPIMRSVYDLALNFYLDWLAPQIVGPRLQAYAEARALGGAALAAVGKQVGDENAAMLGLFDNMKAKAELSPLKDLHDSLYSPLSATAHQDFGVTQAYASTLASGKPRPLSSTERRILLRTIDQAAALVFTRISWDLGGAAPKPA